jgi:AcrR family transcriptional regulator
MKAISRTLDAKPADGSLPSTRSLASELNVSQTTVSRIRRSLNLRSGHESGRNNSQRTYDSEIQSASANESRRKRFDYPSTRAIILAAAQQAFSENGYSQASIRDIAAIAGVSSTLLLHYFGSKAGLFEAALSDIIPLDDLLTVINKDLFGDMVSRLILDAKLDMRSPSMVALAIGDPETRSITTRVTMERVLVPLAKWLGPPNAEVRALQILMLSMGFVVYTRQLPVLSSTLMQDDALRAWFAESIQAIVGNPRQVKGRSRL